MTHSQVPCRACQRPLIYLPTKAGKSMPVNAETVKAEDTIFDAKAGHVSHFADCPAAARFRKPKQ